MNCIVLGGDVLCCAIQWYIHFSISRLLLLSSLSLAICRKHQHVHQILKQYQECIVLYVYCVLLYCVCELVGSKCWNWQKTRNVLHTRKHIFRRIFNFWTMYSVFSIFLLWCKFIRASRDIVKTLCSVCCCHKTLTDTFYALQRFLRMQMHRTYYIHIVHTNRQKRNKRIAQWSAYKSIEFVQVSKLAQHHSHFASLTEHEIAKFHLFTTDDDCGVECTTVK